jgi:hypothetical protein
VRWTKIVAMHSSLQAAQVPRPGDLGAAPRQPPLEIVRAFLARPYGPHGTELQHLLNQMRAAPVSGKLVVLVVVPHREWRLARLPERRGGHPEIVPGPNFTALADAERAVFRLRWEAMFGQALPPDV